MLCVCVSHCFGPNFWRCSKHEYIPNCMPSLVCRWIQEYHKMFRYICTLHNGVPRHCLEQFVQFWQLLQPAWTRSQDHPWRQPTNNLECDGWTGCDLLFWWELYTSFPFCFCCWRFSSRICIGMISRYLKKCPLPLFAALAFFCSCNRGRMNLIYPMPGLDPLSIPDMLANSDVRFVGKAMPPLRQGQKLMVSPTRWRLFLLWVIARLFEVTPVTLVTHPQKNNRWRKTWKTSAKNLTTGCHRLEPRQPSSRGLSKW